MNQIKALQSMYNELSKPKTKMTITQHAEKFFEDQAYFNKWLKELTPTEEEHIKDMLVQFYEQVTSFNDLT